MGLFKHSNTREKSVITATVNLTRRKDEKPFHSIDPVLRMLLLLA